MYTPFYFIPFLYSIYMGSPPIISIPTICLLHDMTLLYPLPASSYHNFYTMPATTSFPSTCAYSTIHFSPCGITCSVYPTLLFCQHPLQFGSVPCLPLVPLLFCVFVPMPLPSTFPCRLDYSYYIVLPCLLFLLPIPLLLPCPLPSQSSTIPFPLYNYAMPSTIYLYFVVTLLMEVHFVCAFCSSLFSRS